MDLHVFPIPIPPPTSFSTRSLWVFPVHQARAQISFNYLFLNFIHMESCGKCSFLPDFFSLKVSVKYFQMVTGGSSLFFKIDMWLSLYESVQFSYLVMSDSLRPHGQQHSRPPCPSPTAKPCSNSCPWS